MLKEARLYFFSCALLNGHDQTFNSTELVGVKTRPETFVCGIGRSEEYVRVSAYLDWIKYIVWSPIVPNKATSGAVSLSMHFKVVLTFAVLIITNFDYRP